MRIEIGQPVYARGGERVGTVDRVMLDAATEHVDRIAVHRGLLSTDRLVDRSLVADAGEDGVWLTIDADAVDALPEFSPDRFPVASPEDAGALPGVVPIAAGTLLYATAATVEPGGARRGSTSGGLPLGDVQIDRGAAVVDAAGQPVGRVHAVFFDAAGAVTGVLVRTVHLRYRDVAVPAEWIAAIDDDLVRLSVSADEATGR